MRKILNGASILTLLIVSQCATSSGNYCDLYEPVRTLEGGRKDQRDAIDHNNAVYMEMCDNRV